MADKMKKDVVVEEVVSEVPASEEQKEVKEKKEKNPKKKKIVDTILMVLQIVLILVCVGISIFIILNPGNTFENPEDASVNVLVVQTDSMEPTIGVGDMLFDSKLDASYRSGENIVDLGEVLTFAQTLGQTYYFDTHRVVGYRYSYTEGEQTKFDEYYLHDAKKAWSEIKQSGWKFEAYITAGDKYTLAHRNSYDGKPIAVEADGGYKIVNYQSINDLNGDFQVYGVKMDTTDSTKPLVVTVDGVECYVCDTSNVVGHSARQAEVTDESKVIGLWSGNKLTVIGRVVYWLRGGEEGAIWHFVVIILVPLLLLFGYNIYLVIKMIVLDKQQKARQEAIAEAKSNEEEIKRKAIEEYLASLNKKEDEKKED